MSKVKWGRLILLAGVILGGSLFFPSIAIANGSCGDEGFDCATIEQSTPGGSGGGGVWRCTGPSTVGAIWIHEGYTCAEGQITIGCDGNITERRMFAYGDDLCPTALTAFRKYCDPASGFGNSDGFCELVDYSGERIRLRVCAPPHEFEARPYPVGFVAREDPFGTFHPTVRLKWRPPPLWNKEEPYPTYADSATADSNWRLWAWGNGQNRRGPGTPPLFPCDLSEEELLARDVPEGTTCIRMQLWSAPAFDSNRNPVYAPGLLEFPSRRMRMQLMPGREVALNFPYASHPATGQTEMVRFGSKELPAFPGFFQRWWPVRLRVDVKWVKDHPRTEERCEPVPDANQDGRPDRGGDCWMWIGDPPVMWPGDKKTITVIERKTWETEYRDGILDLTMLGRRYPALHPAKLFIYGPDRRWESNYQMRNGTPWLWIPLAVREGQGAVCADPTCGGYQGPSGP